MARTNLAMQTSGVPALALQVSLNIRNALFLYAEVAPQKSRGGNRSCRNLGVRRGP